MKKTFDIWLVSIVVAWFSKKNLVVWDCGVYQCVRSSKQSLRLWTKRVSGHIKDKKIYIVFFVTAVAVAWCSVGIVTVVVFFTVVQLIFKMKRRVVSRTNTNAKSRKSEKSTHKLLYSFATVAIRSNMKTNHKHHQTISCVWMWTRRHVQAISWSLNFVKHTHRVVCFFNCCCSCGRYSLFQLCCLMNICVKRVWITSAMLSDVRDVYIWLCKRLGIPYEHSHTFSYHLVWPAQNCIFVYCNRQCWVLCWAKCFVVCAVAAAVLLFAQHNRRPYTLEHLQISMYG